MRAVDPMSGSGLLNLPLTCSRTKNDWLMLERAWVMSSRFSVQKYHISEDSIRSDGFISEVEGVGPYLHLAIRN